MNENLDLIQLKTKKKWSKLELAAVYTNNYQYIWFLEIRPRSMKNRNWQHNNCGQDEYTAKS